MWVLTNQGQFVVDGDTAKPVIDPDRTISADLMRVLREPIKGTALVSGEIWAYSNHIAYQTRGESVSLFPEDFRLSGISEDLRDRLVIDSIHDINDEPWIVTNVGLFRVTESGVSIHMLTTTSSASIGRFVAANLIQTPFGPMGRGWNKNTKLVRGNDNTIWVATVELLEEQNSGTATEPYTRLFTHPSNSEFKLDGHLADIAYHQGQVWCATTSGLYVIRNGEVVKLRSDSMSSGTFITSGAELFLDRRTELLRIDHDVTMEVRLNSSDSIWKDAFSFFLPNTV